MLGIAMYTTIKTLWEQGSSKSSIAKLMKLDWKTVSKVVELVKQGVQEIVKKPHPSILDQHKEQILEWLEKDLSGVRIHELLAEKGVKISYSGVKHYITNFKGQHNICVRFHTGPGVEAQVDFGYAGYQLDEKGKLRKAWVFNMRLCFSRLDYYEIVFNQTIETFIKCHINAFIYYGGVVEIVRIDNLKAAILEANFFEPIYQKQYLKFAKHYGFNSIPCRIRHPEEKGKTESGIKFFKSNFIKGRKFNNQIDRNATLKCWLEKINLRIHGTTRKPPRELFELQEKSCLKTLPREQFIFNTVGARLVGKDCHIYVNYSYYSVPFKYCGKNVEIEVGENLIKIYYEGKQIAMHQKTTNRGEFITQESHYPEFKLITSKTNKLYYQEKMIAMGTHAAEFLSLAIKEQPYHWLNTIRGILSLNKIYTPAIIDSSCKRAIAYNAISYRIVKNICDSGCYVLPIDLEHQRGEATI